VNVFSLITAALEIIDYRIPRLTCSEDFVSIGALSVQWKASVNMSSTGFFFFVRVLLLLLVIAPNLEGQEKEIVGTIDIVGLSVFSPDEVTKEFVTRPGSPYVSATLLEDLDKLNSRYQDRGYFYSHVDSISNKSTAGTIDLTVFMEEGKPSIIDSISFAGDSALSESRLRQTLPIKEGAPFVQSDVEEGVNAILEAYENAGFPFAKVSIDDITMDAGLSDYRVKFIYNITEGKQVRIKELRVEGNTLTRSSVIVREARLRGNEFYTENLSETIKRRLDRLQLFSSVSVPEFFLNQKEEGGLLVKVKEGNPNRFDGIVGYVPSPRAGIAGYVTGLVDLQFRNLFGTGRRLTARWSRENQSTQELGLQYYEPWIASYPINGQIGFVQRIQDSTYVRRQIDLGIDFSLNDQLAIGGVFSRTNVIPSESYGRTVLAESQGTSVGLSISYDTRNDPVTPVKGIYYRTEYDLGTKDVYGSSLYSSSSNSTQRVLMDLDYYIEPILSQVVAAELHIQDFRSNLIELGDLFRLGGASTLRGYSEGQFLGSRLVWSNLEYRFLVARRSFFYGFLDAGYIVTPNEPLAGLQGAEQTKLGYGVGIRMDTNLGLIGVSIGFGEGDTFSTAKLHIQLINAF
jgi:outer membrane protein assembly factor BamA